MSRFFRCDGCGGEMQTPGAYGRRSGQLTGDDVPSVEFDWCRLCTRAAFRGVRSEAEARRRKLGQGEMLPGVATVPQDATQVLQGPAANVKSWLPRRGGSRDLEETRVTGELPR